MRHVFTDGKECLHIYANPRSERDYGKAGNISFDGPMAYSYGHYAIGRIIDYKKRLALVQSENYSMTTAKHISYLYSALSHYERLFVPDLGTHWGKMNDLTHAINVGYFKSKYDAAAGKAKKALVWNPYEECAERLQAAKTYCSWFHCTNRLPKELRSWLRTSNDKIQAMIDAKDKEIMDRRERLNKLHSDPNYQAKLDRARERKYGNMIRAYREKLEAWRRHEASHIPYLSYRERKRLGYAYNSAILRLSTDRTRIETSQGAKVLVESAKVLWALCKRSHDNQTFTSYSKEEIKIDFYRLNNIHNGDISIGCHYIEFSEIEYIAKEIGLIDKED